jgi:two-component sensor histidine kinase
MNAITPVGQLSDSLAMAMVASSHAPLVLIDGDLKIVAASLSFCAAFHVDPNSIAGHSFAELGKGEWQVPQFTSLLQAALDGRAELIDGYEMDLKRPGRPTRQLLLNVHKLIYADRNNTLLLLEVTDVTDVRAEQRFTESLVREKSLLLDELQHRVANSLQIIAGVLMQSAARVASDETRRHLYDAHNRVMSVASLQHHLATTRLEDVELRSYLVDLCKSIGASMIHDPEQISLEVRANPCVASADVSMSLGLIVTELAINAIKHAFPNQKRGTIVVGYRVNGPDWTLTVEDDGVGMSSEPRDAVAGLGTSLVQALAKQLGAEITLTDGNPGTRVSIAHEAVEVGERRPLMQAV